MLKVMDASQLSKKSDKRCKVGMLKLFFKSQRPIFLRFYFWSNVVYVTLWCKFWACTDWDKWRFFFHLHVFLVRKTFDLKSFQSFMYLKKKYSSKVLSSKIMVNTDIIHLKKIVAMQNLYVYLLYNSIQK